MVLLKQRKAGKRVCRRRSVQKPETPQKEKHGGQRETPPTFTHTHRVTSCFCSPAPLRTNVMCAALWAPTLNQASTMLNIYDSRKSNLSCSDEAAELGVWGRTEESQSFLNFMWNREDERTARRSHDDTVCLFGVGGGAGGYSRPCVCVNGNCIHSHVYLMWADWCFGAFSVIQGHGLFGVTVSGHFQLCGCLSFSFIHPKNL